MRLNVHSSVALITAFALLVSALATTSGYGIIYLLMLYLLVAFLVRIDAIAISRGVLRLWPLLLATFMLHVFIGSGTSVNFTRISDISSYYHEIPVALLFTGRLVLIIVVSFTLFALLSPTQIAREIGRWCSGMPLARKTIAQTELLISLALRFVPSIAREYQRLRLALAARKSVSNSRLARIRTLRQILYPLLINSFRRADNVALALQARGYDPSVKRTSITYRRATSREKVLALIIIAVLFVAPWL